MPTDDEVTRLLMSFGLNEKEARLYLQLLKYGPKTLSQLAKSLNTYRTDVHRTSNTLIEKGMVRPSLNSPAIYTAVNLDAALASVLEKHESELRELRARSQELQELAKPQQFAPSGEVATFKILKNIREVNSAAVPVMLSAKEEYLWLANRQGVEFGEAFGFFEAEKAFTERGGRCRGITDISYELISMIRRLLDIGSDIRHFGGYRGAYFGVFDKKYCFSAINIDVQRVRLDEPISMLYTDDPVFADYLISTFEMVWRQSVPAEERIRELLKQGPPHDVE